MYQMPSHVNGTTAWLTNAGIPASLASMAAPGMYLTPFESDPSNAIQLVLVSGAQKLLKRLGYGVSENGRLDAHTQNALSQIVGPAWASRPWNIIYMKLIDARNEPVQGQAGLGDLSMDDITCTKNLCTPKNPSTKQTFMDLQNQVNRLASRVGITPLTVDGLVGPNTGGKVKLTAQFVGGYQNTISHAAVVAGAAASNATALTYFALNADSLAEDFRAVADLLQIKQAPKPVVTSSTGKPAPSVAAVLPKPTSNGPSWTTMIGGTTGVIIIGAAAALLLFTHKGKEAPMIPLTNPFRRRSRRRRRRR